MTTKQVPQNVMLRLRKGWFVDCFELVYAFGWDVVEGDCGMGGLMGGGEGGVGWWGGNEWV